MMSTKRNGNGGEASKQMTAKSDDGKKKEAAKNPAPAPKAKPAPEKKVKADDRERKEKKKDDQGGLMQSIGEGRQFLKEVWIEFNKITWPERSRVIRETYSVLILVALITVMVLCFDWFLGNAIFGPLEHWARMHGGGIGRG